MAGPGQRCFVIWFPDWPVTAWRRSEGAAIAEAVAIVLANQVLACSAAARRVGVRRGQTRREAQAACPELRIVWADPARDQRLFEPLMVCLEDLAPGVQQIRAGLVAIRARGLARYYGGELAAAQHLLGRLGELGVSDGHIGIADGVFSAEQAAYSATPIRLIAPGEAAAFLAPLPVERLGDEELSRLLPQLGVRQLGQFAALARASVRQRFGERGVRLHLLASGEDNAAIIPRLVPVELAVGIDFEPGLSRVDQVGFSVRQTAGQFIAGLAKDHLVCTELRLTISGEQGERSERVWLHPAAFNAAAVVDRVRWQLEAVAGELRSPVTRVQFDPVALDAAAHHEPGLFGSGADERVHHTLSRVQALLGHEGVLTAQIGGGRWLAERQVLVPWGDRAVVPLANNRPWPGHLPPPLPALVFPNLRPATVFAASGALVGVDERGGLSASPWQLIVDDEPHHLSAWVGPWPIDERGWDPVRQRSAYRFQVLDRSEGAWLLVLDGAGAWWVEGRYD